MMRLKKKTSTSKDFRLCRVQTDDPLTTLSIENFVGRKANRRDQRRARRSVKMLLHSL